MDLCIFEVKKKPSGGTPFSVFLSDGGAPKRRGAQENFPRFPPLDGPDFKAHTYEFFAQTARTGTSIEEWSGAVDIA